MDDVVSMQEPRRGAAGEGAATVTFVQEAVLRGGGTAVLGVDEDRLAVAQVDRLAVRVTREAAQALVTDRVPDRLGPP